jgi:hypothetical protein
VIVKTLETTPKNATHWSTRSLAREVGLTQTAVHDIWQAFGLKPHRQEKWKLSTDPQFAAKVGDVVGLYLNPPERAVVLAVDEKSQIQALDRTRPILPMLPGTPERATHDYKRHGTSSLYAALDLATGKVIGKLHSRHRAIELKKFLNTIDQAVPQHLDVDLVCWTPPRRTRRRRSNGGCSRTSRSGCTSPRPPVAGSTSSSGRSRNDHKEAQAVRAPFRPRAERRHPRVDRYMEREPQPFV